MDKGVSGETPVHYSNIFLDKGKEKIVKVTSKPKAMIIGGI